MASTVVAVLLTHLLLQHVSPSGGSSHWVVTEDGRVQSQFDSVFNMRRPYDLVAFMRQEERSSLLEKLKEELLSRKDEIDKNEDRDTGLEQRFYKTDPDCLSAGKPLPEFDLYISTVLPLENKGIRPEEHIDVNTSPGSSLLSPNCELFEDLPFSMEAFEHLEGMKEREMLSGTPELGLKNAITYQDNVDEYGHRVYEALKKNTTSWVLYNMAAFYWRIKGDPYNTIECVRRALHFSPRMQRDVALISLANILHRARYSNEAAIVVHAALDISKELNVNHFTLGNIYAVMAEYNKSVICFENTLKIQPDFKAAAERKHAVLCHAKLESALDAQHKSLQRTLNDLKDYQKKHDFWQQQNEKLNSEQINTDSKMAQHLAYENVKMREANVDMGEYCHIVDREGKQVLMCTWGRQTPDAKLDFTPFPDGPKEPAAKEKQKPEEEEEVSIIDYTKPVRSPLYSKEKKLEAPKYTQPDNDWPAKDECDTYVQKVPDPRNLSTVYLSPENKGFEVRALLTEAQTLQPGDEHPLPWYPPVCNPLMEIPEGRKQTYDHVKSVSYEERTRIPLKMTDQSMTEILLAHVNEGQITVEEIGQRLLTALKQKIGPGWVLYNLAGLYWRIIGNNYQGIECIRRSLHLVQPEYKDVPLINLANILYRWGRYDDAVTIMKDALAVSDVEPESHFFYGNLLWATKNYTGAVKHYQKSLDIQPENQDTFNTLRAIKCYLKFHHAAQSVAPKDPPAQQGPNCPQRPTNGNVKNQETESRVICKNENGEEKCVIETRSRTKSRDCNGHCTQTCTVTPIKLDGCTGEIDPVLAIGSENQCVQKGPTQPFPASGSGDEPIFTGDFSAKLDDISEHYLKKGICQGEECSQLRVQQQGGQKPHIKLDFVDGVLHQKLIFVQSSSELPVEPHECVIFNDGSKSSGCSRSEFKSYLEDVINSRENFEQIELVLMDHINAQSSCGKPKSEQQKSSQCSCNQATQNTNGKSTSQEPQKQQCNTCGNCAKGKACVKPPVGPKVEKIERTSVSSRKKDNSHDAPVSAEILNEELKVQQFPDSELPDTSYHIGRRFHMAMPTQEECQTLNKVDFAEFTSTLLSVTAKGINPQKHIDFDKVIKRDLEEPFCVTDFSTQLDIDSLPGIINKANLRYFPETGLKEVLQKMGGDNQPVDVIGTRIAQALKKNMTSWVLSNIAALYWRVEGDAKRAIDCLRLSLTTAPPEVQDTALISIANILRRSGYINDAIVVTSMALDTPNKLVVSHFTMANLYAVKGEWEKAIMFYESTLGLQSSFEPAKQRLKTIKCKNVIKK